MVARACRCSGFTYLTILFVVAIMGAGLALAGEVWYTAAMREKEAELLYVGNQFRKAIMLYYERTPGPAKRYPSKLEDLLQDQRYPTMQRYLRKLYADPMTGKPEWGLVAAPGGGIMGVYSLSGSTPIKTSGFLARDRTFEGANHFSDWKFFYSPSPQMAPKPGQVLAPLPAAAQK